MPKGKKETSQEISRIAAIAINSPEKITLDQIKSMAASLLSQDETKGE